MPVIIVCPYCMNKVNDDTLGCCGESSAHFIEACVIGDTVYLLNELTNKQKESLWTHLNNLN